MEIRLFKPLEGEKEWMGELTGYTGKTVSIRIGDRTVAFEREQLADMRLHIDF